MPGLRLVVVQNAPEGEAGEAVEEAVEEAVKEVVKEKIVAKADKRK